VALGTVGLREKALWKTAELSYGDKRKLEIALALCLRPSVLLLTSRSPASRTWRSWKSSS